MTAIEVNTAKRQSFIDSTKCIYIRKELCFVSEQSESSKYLVLHTLLNNRA